MQGNRPSFFSKPTLRSAHDTSAGRSPPRTRWPASTRPPFEPQNTSPLPLAQPFQGWPSGRPRQLIEFLHPARSRADNADQPSAETGSPQPCYYEQALPCPAFADRGGISEARPRPHLILAMAARRHAEVRQVASALYLQCRPAGPRLCTYLILTLLAAGHFGCSHASPGLPRPSQHSPYAYAMWSCGAAKSRCSSAPRCMLFTSPRPISASGTPDGSIKPLPSSAAESQPRTANGEAAVPIYDFQMAVSACDWVEL
ncbi:hypothetical protein N431DRAFT_449681 [Stipitochalara longipes BDJ]|nr:hypothetical protein N431DRAFT_449681 [Stipitochalara longipes BDJ]